MMNKCLPISQLLKDITTVIKNNPGILLWKKYLNIPR